MRNPHRPLAQPIAPTQPEPESAVACRRVVAHGIVQGVGFQASCVRYARAHSVTGWVRNRGDGSVEAMLQGATPALAAMCEWLRREVPGAQVDALEVSALPPPFERCDDFSQHGTA